MYVYIPPTVVRQQLLLSLLGKGSVNTFTRQRIPATIEELLDACVCGSISFSLLGKNYYCRRLFLCGPYRIVEYTPVAKQWFCKQRLLLGNARNTHVNNNRRTGLRNGPVNTPATIGALFEMMIYIRSVQSGWLGIGSRVPELFVSWAQEGMALWVQSVIQL
jgi:hypothetical protein